MLKTAKLRQYFGTNKKSSPTKWYTKRPKTAKNQPYIPNVNRFVYIKPMPKFYFKQLPRLISRFGTHLPSQAMAGVL